MDDEKVSQFVSLTGASPEKAQQYLKISEDDVERAIDLFFNTGGIDLAPEAEAAAAAPSSQAPPAPEHSRLRDEPDVITIDSDSDGGGGGGGGGGGRGGSSSVPTEGQGTRASTLEDDEAMARRLQEELYGGGGSTSGVPASDLDAEGYRAPIAPTRETLVGPDPYNLGNPGDMNAAVMEQMMARRQRYSRSSESRPGIFNQQNTSSSIWNEESGASSRERNAALSRATGGASDASKKSNMLAEMFRPPAEIISNISWDEARDQGKGEKKWILVNVQDPSIFDCQLLNRDIWKDEGVQETVRENFIFMQFSKDDSRGFQYMQYYFPNKDIESLYPHIAIVDPRTGEQVKLWSGPPAPKAGDFLMQVHEFLDRYSLSSSAKNPVARRKPDQKKEKEIERMTEEEQMAYVLQKSLEGSSSAPKDDDPDDLTRSIPDLKHNDKGKGVDVSMIDTDSGQADDDAGVDSTFASISSTNPHEEPAANAPGTTRIQFRHPNGRVVRRFEIADPVRRIYEWLKASPLESQEGKAFELVSMGTNLMDKRDETIEAAGLKNGTVMIEYIED